MLSLTRRAGQTIHIGDDIIIHILSISGNQTRVGVECSNSIPVHRSEIYARIQDEMKNAQSSMTGNTNDL